MGARESAAGSPLPDWRVLLVGGSSGTGKSRLARELARLHGASWLDADDFRLALQRSTMRLTHPALHFFVDERLAPRADFWQLTPEAFRDGLIGVGEVVSQALEIVIANHVAQARPIVLEGDGIRPELTTQHTVTGFAAGNVRAVFLVEPDAEALFANMRERSPGMAHGDVAAQCNHARANWLFGLWLREQAGRHGLPVVEPRPYDTLVTRVERAIRCSPESDVDDAPGSADGGAVP